LERSPGERASFVLCLREPFLDCVRGALSTRLIVWVGVPATVVFAAVLVLAALQGFQRAAELTEDFARDMAHLHAAKMDGVLQHAQKIPEMMAAEIETGKYDTREKLETWLRWIVDSNPEIYGSCIAFRPNGFRAEEKAYAPYVYRGADGLLHAEQLGKPDYNYFQWAWYREPRDAGRPLWSDPYFDEGGGDTLMITYSVPFRKADQFLGIVTIDIAITQLVEKITAIQVGREGYAFLVDRHGGFQAVPKGFERPSQPLAKEDPLRLAMLAVLDEEGPAAGRVRAPEPLRQGDAIIGFAPIAKGRLIAAFVNPTSEAFADARRILGQQLVLGAVGLLAVFGAIVLVARSVTRPIRDLSDAAGKVAAGEVDLQLAPAGGTQEVEQLTGAFKKMTRDLQLRMQELRYTTTIKQRLEGELNAARSIQMSLLPKVFPAFPDRKEFDVHAIVRPAREVGGDFYDFFLVDERSLCVLISDVAGKGVPAALFMAVSKALIKATASSGLPLAQVVARVNEELCEEADAGMFVTLLIVILDTATGKIDYCNAGHLAPFLIDANGQISPLDGGHSPALALANGLKFQSARRHLVPGDTLFFFTDGVTEALNRAREFYTPQRLQIVLRDVAALPVHKMTRSVVQDVRTFAAEQEQADDISVLALRWIGPTDLTENREVFFDQRQSSAQPFATHLEQTNGR
jgi:sigma-B regulation protein RsbU (phosphoserine phosphatase)